MDLLRAEFAREDKLKSFVRILIVLRLVFEDMILISCKHKQVILMSVDADYLFIGGVLRVRDGVFEEILLEC